MVSDSIDLHLAASLLPDDRVLVAVRVDLSFVNQRLLLRLERPPDVWGCIVTNAPLQSFSSNKYALNFGAATTIEEPDYSQHRVDAPIDDDLVA
jgi:hypothetical protein